MTIRRIEPGPRMSQAVVHGDTVYLAGQVGAPGKSVTEQTKAILKQIDRLLKLAGSNKSKILSAQIWLDDMRDFAEMNAVWDGWVDKENAPGRATGEAALATPDYKVEIIGGGGGADPRALHLLGQPAAQPDGGAGFCRPAECRDRLGRTVARRRDKSVARADRMGDSRLRDGESPSDQTVEAVSSPPERQAGDLPRYSRRLPIHGSRPDPFARNQGGSISEVGAQAARYCGVDAR